MISSEIRHFDGRFLFLLFRLFLAQYMNCKSNAYHSAGNQWTDAFTSDGFLAVFRVIYSLIGSVLSVYAATKLGLFIYYQGSQFNVPQICLAIEFIGNCRT